MDWSNSHILQVFEFFNEKYEQKSKQVVELKNENKELKERILRLEGKVTQIQETKPGSNKNVRSYNARNFTDYPRTKRASTYKNWFSVQTRVLAILT